MLRQLKNLLFAAIAFGAMQDHYLFAGKTENQGWKLSGDIKPLHETPFGTVYQFPYSERAPWDDANDKKFLDRFSKKIIPLEFALPDFEKEHASQYMIIEFALRVFPAISKIKNPNSHIAIGISGIKGAEVKTYDDLVWLEELHSGSLLSGYLFGNCNKCGSRSIGRLDAPISYITQASKTPYYEPEKYRFVFSYDPKAGAVNLHCSGCRKNKRVSRLVIFIPKPPSSSTMLDKEMPRNIIEVSKPSVSFSLKHPDEVKNESQNRLDKKTLWSISVQPMEYPYGSYELPSKMIAKLKNPDHIYACALKLQPYDPPQALKLFESLADSKSLHVLAMYKAGMEYWRGPGAEPDLPKAKGFFHKAADYGLPEAIAVNEIINLKNLPAEQRIGLSSSGKALLQKIDAVCVPKYGHELSFVIRLLRLNKFNRGNLRADDVKNQLMDAISISGRPVEGALKRFPQLHESASFYLAAGINDPGKAQPLFERGAQLGNLECELELMKIKIKEKKITAADFTAKTDLKYADFPQYYALKYAVLNGQMDQIDHLLKIDKNLHSHDSDFNAAAAVLYHFFTGDFRNSKCKLFSGQTDRKLKTVNLLDKNGKTRKTNIRDTDIFERYGTPLDLLISANKKLEYSASQGNKDAIYLLALQYLNGQRTGLKTKNDNNYLQTSRARNFFQTAAEKGHLKAEFMLLKLDSEHKAIQQSQWLTRLEKFQKLDYGPAWLLAAQIAEKLSGNNPRHQEQAIQTYKRAAELGENLANYRLAAFYYRLTKSAAELKNGKIEPSHDSNAVNALTYWKKFLDNDSRKREQDPFDSYSRAAEKNVR